MVMKQLKASPRSILLWVLAAAAGATVAGACTTDAGQGDRLDARDRREVVVDRGTADLVDLRSVTVQAEPGDVVMLRSANPGRGQDDESPVHHLFTSAAAGAATPPLFTAVGTGLMPNAGVWGLCRGGSASDATAGCPLPAIEGPSAYDGKAYFSLGALLPGDLRELPLADDLAPGTYRFTCAIHPGLHVDVQVVSDPVPAEALSPLDAADATRAARERVRETAGAALVVLGPHAGNPPAELLAAVPAVVRIPVGGTVVWRVEAQSPHTVELGLPGAPNLADTAPADTVPQAPDGGRWDGRGVVRSGILSTDPSAASSEFQVTFTRPGRYQAFDRFHAGIATVVQVG